MPEMNNTSATPTASCVGTSPKGGFYENEFGTPQGQLYIWKV